jgi:hypothetical protein
VGGDGRDDDESVSRGGTPAPLSDGSGATLGGGAAGSEASEAGERAGTSGARDETPGDDEGGEGGSGGSGGGVPGKSGASRELVDGRGNGRVVRRTSYQGREHR